MKIKIFLLSSIFSGYCIILFSQVVDKTKAINLQTGYINYSSINSISDPFIYKGSSLNYLLEYEVYTKKAIKGISANYSSIVRNTLNVKIPEFYDVINTDDGNINRIYSHKSEKKTYRIELKFNFFRRVNLNFFDKDNLYIGLSEKNYFVLESNQDNPEIVALSLNPGFIYNISFQKIRLELENSVSVVSLNVRRSYAHMDSKFETEEVSDLQFALDHAQLDAINKHFEIISKISISKSLTKRVEMNLAYFFSYLNSKLPRKLNSVTNILNGGLTYKF